jgi:hypothetical protein
MTIGNREHGSSLLDQLDWIKSMTNVTEIVYVIYKLEQRGRLLNNIHYVYSGSFL